MHIHIYLPISLLTFVFKLFSNLNFEEYAIQKCKTSPHSFLQIECLIMQIYHRPVLF